MSSSDSSGSPPFVSQTLPASTITETITETITTQLERKCTSQVHQYEYKDNVIAVDYSQDGNLLAVAHDNYVDIFQTNTGDADNMHDNMFQPIHRYVLKEEVTSLSFSPDNNYLAVGDYGKSLTIFYDINDKTTTQHDSRCQQISVRNSYGVAFSPDSKYIALQTGPSVLSIYIDDKESISPSNASPSFKFLHNIALHQEVGHTIQFSPDSVSLAIGTLDRIRIYEFATGKLTNEIQQVATQGSIKYSNNGKFLAFGTYVGTLSVYNASTYKCIQEFKSNTEGLNSGANEMYLAFSNSDNFIAMSFCEIVLIYDYFSDGIIYEIDKSTSTDRINALAFSADDKYLTIGHGKSVLTFDTSVYKNVYLQFSETQEYSQEMVRNNYTPIFSPNETYLVSYDQNQLRVFKNIIKDYTTSSTIEVEEGSPPCYTHDTTITNNDNISFSMDEKYIAFFDDNDDVVVYDLVEEKEEMKIKVTAHHEELPIKSIKYSPSGKYLVVVIAYYYDGRERGSVSLYDATDKYTLLSCQNKDDDPVLSVDFSFDEKLLAVFTKHAASIYQLKDDHFLIKPWKEFKLDYYLNKAVFSNDLKFLAVLGDHLKKLEIQDIMEDSTLLSIDRDDKFKSIAFSPDSKILAIGSCEGTLEFRQLFYNDDKSMEWKPYASPIYFSQKEGIEKISFAPLTTKKFQQVEFYTIFLTHRRFYEDLVHTITHMRLHQHTVTPPEIIFESDDERILKILQKEKYSPLTRNQEEKSMISVAVEKNKLSLVEKLLQVNPSLAFAPNYNCKVDDRSNGIMEYLMDRYHLNSLSNVAGGQFLNSSTSLIEVDQMYKVIMKLVQEQVNSNIIVKLLNAGEKDCMDGFVIHGSMYATIEEPTKWWLASIAKWASLLINSLRREMQPQPQISQQEEEEKEEEKKKKQQRRPLAILQKPRSSKTEWVLSAWQDLEKDNKKRVELKVLRVLLPNLASFESLKKFTNMSDNKPFGCQSLHAAIDANWSNWARRRFLVQLIVYVVWLIFLTAFCEVTKQLNVGVSTSIGAGEYGWLEYFLAGIVIFGVLYFIYVEIRQIKVISKEDYLYDWWNIWQWLVMIFAIAIIGLRLIPGTSESLDGCISAISLFFSWIGLLYHLRGLESCAWISIALYRIGKSLCVFILVVTLVIFSFTLALHALHDSRGSSTDTRAPSASPVESGNNFLISLTTTFLASIMGEIDDGGFFEETYFHGLVAYGILILLLVVVYLISQNALIAFISERFERELDEKNAVLKKQKAKVILDLYCLYSKEKREEIENENKWTTLVIPAGDLGLVEEPNTLEKNVSRATKEDIKEMKKDIKEMKKEIKDVNVETKEDMKKEMKEMMEMQEATTKELKVMMQQIIETISNISK